MVTVLLKLIGISTYSTMEHDDSLDIMCAGGAAIPHISMER